MQFIPQLYSRIVSICDRHTHFMPKNAINIKGPSMQTVSSELSHAVTTIFGYLTGMQKGQTRFRPLHDLLQVQHYLTLLTFKFDA